MTRITNKNSTTPKIIPPIFNVFFIMKIFSLLSPHLSSRTNPPAGGGDPGSMRKINPMNISNNNHNDTKGNISPDLKVKCKFFNKKFTSYHARGGSVKNY